MIRVVVLPIVGSLITRFEITPYSAIIGVPGMLGLGLDHASNTSAR